ncbi:putative disease resistance RPP13-like protein 3 [Brachypodium distachyon]|uniref:putative disease resistance RPP13-like protein 3 n=1 Tax=Brachypodium distachyon TaxID=15368 RepID=UPI000D0DBF67|nr:putative disease resistance RPP13-like protein 3 [Brachypodium distachyon]|eukprot:XP_024311499.1 putative disease resistance RPP13-like protein 3 [Brachypodium distachyon]
MLPSMEGVNAGPSDIKFLRKELEAMHAFLLVMSDVEQPDEQAKIRVKAVRDLSYDIEDNIDKFMQLVEPESSSNDSGFMDLISKCKRKVKDIKTRHEIAKEVKHIKDQVKEVSERYARYTIDGFSAKPRNAKVDPRVMAVIKDASELVGIDGPRDELVRYLGQDGDESTRHLKFVSLVGYGGLGKITLANQVYQKLGANFECQAMVSISRDPDMTKILSSVLSQISNGGKIHGRSGDQQAKISQIREFLENKWYLIVIDDIWDVPTWRILECALFKNRCGSRIMITTRINDVAKSCCSSIGDLVYKMKPLNKDDSKKLFYKRIFGSEENCPFDFKEASADILKKCGGLPLAINSISSLLATRQTKEEWDQLALFPEDYKIRRERLVRRWISEGLIRGEDGEDLAELGDVYFHELVNRSLIQPVDIGYDGKAYNKVRRLSLMGDGDESNVIKPHELDLSHVRSIGAFGYGFGKQIPFFLKSDALRVLDLEGCFGLEEHHLKNIARFSQLRATGSSNDWTHTHSEFNLDVYGACIITSGGFQQLQKFAVECNDLMFENGAMPKLMELRLYIRSIKCNSGGSSKKQKKINSGGVGVFDFGIHGLPCLATVHVIKEALPWNVG